MGQQFSKKFYNSKEWLHCRRSYIQSVYGLCERCTLEGNTEQGYILHHKIHLTHSNISNPNITLNWSNLEWLCLYHHNVEHGLDKTGGKDKEVIRDGLMFTDNGDIVSNI